MPVSPPSSAAALLRRALSRHRGRLAGSAALLVLWQICETSVPVMIGLVVDRAVDTGKVSSLLTWGLALAGLFAVLSYGYRYGARLGFGAMQREMHQLRVEISEHVLAPRGARTGLLPGEILSLATSDTAMVGAGLRMINQVVASLASVVVAAWLLLRIDLGLGLVVLVGVPAVLVLVQLITPRISRHASAQQQSIARATGVATDLVRGLRPLKGIGAEATASRRYRELSQDARESSIRTARSYGLLEGFSTTLNGLLLALVALLAGRLALDGGISIGELIAVVGLAQYLAEPVGALGAISARLASSYASAGRIAAYLGTPPLVVGGTEAPTRALPMVRLDAVTSGRLAGLTLETRPGELLGLVVTDPAAADTIVTLLRGETGRADREGVLSLGEVEYADLRLDALRAQVVVSRHHVDVFEGTLRSNIAAEGALDDDTLKRVLDVSAAADVAALHPDGVDHPTTAGGSTLSGGQRQRLALARALAADPPILVLQEPTTAVDAVTEQHIAEGIRRLRHQDGSERSTVVLTSSPALLAQADRVLLVQEGRVLAEGDHLGLSATPAYRTAVLR